MIKQISFFLALILTLAILPSASAAGFQDVKSDDWFAGAVDYVLANKLMNGYSVTDFGPNDSLSRAMMVQILYNKEGQPTVSGDHGFSDVPVDQWFNNAVAWGAQKGVMSGYGDGKFGPEDTVTIEQIAVILWNYSGNPAFSASADTVGAHSDWAANGLGWAVEKGLLNGVPYQAVTDGATRAQTAQILTNYLSGADNKPSAPKDSKLSLLMVGNSFCYYYVEELYALLMENLPYGIEEVEIYNLYYSGCTLTTHLNWWRNATGKYDLFRTDADGRQKLEPAGAWTLEQALAQGDWDYISLQGTVKGGSYMDPSVREATREGIAAAAEPLLDRFHELFPDAQLLWHRTWFFEIGRVTNSHTYTAEDGPLYNEGMQEICDYMCNEFDLDKPYDLIQVNSGEAWTKARELNESANLLPYGGLCARNGKKSFGDKRDNAGDGYHDGDIGGAQLLNAYRWYMTITGDTDLTDSTYVPVYREVPLDTELVNLLKRAAMSVPV
ncbi:MAG: S-layer homology domain-containing protein [Oscillospiraceae bacterium]|nr:S-layer homology domain-containing protein [Oscillospiraceae bacterium]